jgi:hypothetical protein
LCLIAHIGDIFSSASFAWLHATFCFVLLEKCAIAVGVRAELCGPSLMALVICNFVHGLPIIAGHPCLDHLLMGAVDVEFHFSWNHICAIPAKSLPKEILQNSICSGNSRKISFAQDSDWTPNLSEIPPCVWCTTECYHTKTKQKSHLLVWMMRSHAMSNFQSFPLIAHETMFQ